MPGRGRGWRRPRPRGFSLAELLVALGIAAVLTATAVPALLTASTRSQTWAAARYLGTRMAAARSYAVVHAATTALRFDGSGQRITFQMFVDGDGDGIRTADIASRIDEPVGGPSALADLFPGVIIGVAPEVGTDAVRIGASNLLSFTPLGTATSGSIFLLGSDGTQLAIRILGATGRTRVERYEPISRQWVAWF